MSGLERIIEKIEADAEMSADAVLAEAEKKAAEIIAEAESEGDLRAHGIIADAKAECDAMKRKAHSGGELLRRKRILERKVEIIDSVISKAVENFMRYDPEKYFDAMVRLAEKYASPGEHEMIFSDKDFGRLPADFEKRVNDAVQNSKITVRGGGGFDGGFLLVGNELVENCTIDALIGESDTEIRDELCKILFA